ncbi:MAG: hypothetical protein JWO85_1965 [Candidatus Eremiobacteraeota bacterium]|jgi:uncharacterized protein (DUF488 family)|nr:hypothetical protein [Candidatus Eremiobacteraeota bacterium]
MLGAFSFHDAMRTMKTNGTVTLYTIGFTKTSAERFFATLRQHSVKRVIDTRLNRDGQLAGFAKAQDLQYFLRELVGADYAAEPLLAPTAELLRRYRDKTLTWDQYAQEYVALLRERTPERALSPAVLNDACLLCSEATPEHCHRRLAADYLKSAFVPAPIEVVHL